MGQKLLEGVDKIWFCDNCEKTFLFDNDAEYHKIKTNHNLSRSDI